MNSNYYLMTMKYCYFHLFIINYWLLLHFYFHHFDFDFNLINHHPKNIYALFLSLYLVLIIVCFNFFIMKTNFVNYFIRFVIFNLD